MPNNFLVTGRPGSGKSTVISATIELLREKGFVPGGLFCPEIREGNQRLGFKMIDLATRTERILAHVNQPKGPQVSRYRVNLENVDFMAELSLERSLEQADFVVIDEIAPMELFSTRFRQAVRQALDSPKPLLAAIHERTKTGFIGEVKRRPDVRLWTITPANRAVLPRELAEAIHDVLRNLR
jgi:nucleoside-triphosphatase